MDAGGVARLPPHGLDGAEARIPARRWPSAEADDARSCITSRAWDRARAAKHLTERDIPELVNISVTGVHVMFERSGRPGAEHHRRVVYPRWQVTSDRALLPHLSAVVERVDGDTLRGAVEDGRAECDGLTAVERLRAGREVTPVLRTLRDLDRA